MSQKSSKKERGKTETGKKEQQKTVSKNETVQQTVQIPVQSPVQSIRKTVRERDGKVKVTLPKDLRSRVAAETDPDEIIAEALLNYYSGQRLRSELAVQKEIDNSIIEIQRRHISDLKEQLTASNKNYEELMKTYQAYMFQVQPLIENAKLRESEKAGKISAPKEKTESEVSTNEKIKNDEMKREATKADIFEKSEKESIKTKKWYEFWK